MTRRMVLSTVLVVFKLLEVLQQLGQYLYRRANKTGQEINLSKKTCSSMRGFTLPLESKMASKVVFSSTEVTNLIPS